MAVDLTLKGTAITNREAAPRVLNNPGLGEGAQEMVAFGYLASVTASLSVGSIIRLVSVPSNAVVTGLWLTNVAQTAGAADFGLYRTNGDGGAVVDADFFGSAVAISGAVNNTSILTESAVNTIAKQGQRIWEAAGMSADPKAMLDIAATITTNVTTGTGAIALRVSYVE